MKTRKTPKKARLTPLGRLMSLVAILLVGAIVGAAGASATRPHAQAWRCISVRPGETLWSIASHNPQPDRRQTVDRILEANRMSALPQAGTAIWVPNEGSLTGLDQLKPTACPDTSD